MSSETIVRLMGGKYELRHENGRNFRALRYGGPWTLAEDRAVRAHYASGGAAAVQAAGVDRTADAIGQYARRNAIPGPPPIAGPREPLPVPDGLDAALLAGKPVADLSRRFARSRSWLKNRAMKIGATIPRGNLRPYDPAELAIIEAAAGLSPLAVQKRLAKAGFVRTQSAIVSQRKKMGLSNAREFERSYPMEEWGRLLGVSADVPRGWTLTRHDPLPTRKGARSALLVHEDDFRAWLARNPSRLNFRKVPPASYPWLVEVLTGISPSQPKREE